MKKIFVLSFFVLLLCVSSFSQTIYYNAPVANHSWLLPSLNTVATYGYPTVPQYVVQPNAYYPTNVVYPTYYAQPVVYPVVQNYYYTLPVHNYYVYPNYSPYFYSMYSPYYYMFRW